MQDKEKTMPFKSALPAASLKYFLGQSAQKRKTCRIDHI
jgi:hypothetical protein